ncbi:unnamed protein product [Adineta steineri]|uniref:G-protein coupled receptors family 1 profile domain-containing protein n=1 Tax=Adineta steineri TaxID=433720 RepID=A0A815Q7B2_9BILA|nr:unnamed protein product [Adineta steineri]
MEINETNNSSNTEISLSKSIQFWLLSILDVPSIICSLFLLYHLLTKQIRRSTLNNHVIIKILLINLFIQLIDIPLYLNFLRSNPVWPQTLVTCIVWWYTTHAMYNTTIILTAWLYFERYIRIFHNECISTKIKQWLFHYISIIFFLIFPMIYYILILFIPSCEQQFIYDYTQAWCALCPCYYNNNLSTIVDITINSILPCLLIALFSIVLLIHTIWIKNIRLKRVVQWKQYRKMIIQLFSISSLFIIFNSPLMLYYLLYILQYVPLDVDPQIGVYLNFLSYFSTLFLPFSILFSLSHGCFQNEWKKFRKYFRKHRANVHPIKNPR